MKTFFLQLVISSLLLFSSFSSAYDKGDWIARVGFASVHPNENADPLALNGTELSALGLGLPRTEASVNDNAQMGLTITRMLSSSWGIELLAATPFTHQIRADALGVDAAEIKHLPPTLNLQYYFNDGAHAFQPYIGVGLNYTAFFDEEVDSELNAALQGLGATGDASLELDPSSGYSLELGFDYQYNERWVFNAVLWYIDISTTATFDVPALGQISADVDINPYVFMTSLGYRF